LNTAHKRFVISYKEARRCIEKIEKIEFQMFLKTLYLLAARGCELAGEIDSDASAYRLAHKIIYGPKGTDVSLTTMNLDDSSKVTVALFKITNARQRIHNPKKLPKRIVAVPMPREFEPWTEGLFNFFKERGDNYVFPFKRQQVWKYLTTNRVFKNGTYRIRRYTYSKYDKEWVFDVLPHPRSLKMFGLRYLRSDELRCEYGFDYSNWFTYANAHFGKGNSMRWRDWRSYIFKLCKRTP
jgi:hypothetical protein